jgi:2-dehydro-3-deoxy-D-gluconate 5-dehydrogenase
MEMFSLSGRTALVTGARGGIGAAIAEALAAAGADLILHGHRDDLDATEQACKAYGVGVRRIVLDFAQPERVAVKAFELAREGVDILVNNAGTIARGPVLTAPFDEWREVQAVNVDSAFALTQPIAAAMAERRAGKIIFVASLLSFQGGVNVASYAASKHAVTGLTKALSNELAAYNVQVNALAPGYIATDNTRPLRSDRVREPQIRARIPAGRWGRPADLAGPAVFLASAASDYVTGHVLVADGGWLAR